MAHVIDLNGSWKFKAIDAYRTLPSEYRKTATWMPGTVPGTVHTDLMALGVIPDPYFRTNENDVQWIDQVQWLYRRSFDVPRGLLRERVVRLRADGLDTFARVQINGRTVGNVSNMFVGHEFNVKGFLKEGKNLIEILFDSPVFRAKALERIHGRLRVALEPHRVYARKAQYSFSWDWGPKLTTSGIWRGISVEAFSGARLRDPFVRVVTLTTREAIVRISAELEGKVRAGSALRIAVSGGGWRGERRVAVRGRTINTTIRIPNPHLWWPNGHGGQPLYEAALTLSHGGMVMHDERVRFAIRTVRLIQERDRAGKSFIVEVNGRKIFCKGADWIPADNFIPRIPDSRYETLLVMARDAHMNMIRVWGGGIYENDIFYDLCDRLGLMVWQDFMFACGEYPDQRWFLRDVRSEAASVVKRLRNHPGIVVWCGNNECEWLFCAENPGKRPDEMRGARIFRDLLPAVLRSLDGTRPYWRSSPFGDGFPNDESNGNHHQWTVWSAWKDFAGYREDCARFVTEFGFQAPAHLKTMESCTLPSDRHPQHSVVEFHNKQVEGPERLVRFMSGHYRIDMDFARFIYHGQLVQAEALKCAVEHWRRRKYLTAGSLFWQLNDCWPVASWSVIDSGLRPKAAYFYAKRFYAPLLVSFAKNPGGVAVWMTNDRPERVDGELTISRRTFDGTIVWSDRQSVRVAPDASRRVALIEDAKCRQLKPEFEYLLAELAVDGATKAVNRYFFAEPKHLILPEPGLKTDITENGPGTLVLSLSAAGFAKDVWVELESEDAVFDDNFVDIDPGSTKVIRVFSPASARDAESRLKVTSLR
jgi:beta-mannosidase